MPQVRTYGGRQVDTAALPGVRRQAAETPTSEGAPLYEAEADTARTRAAVFGLGARIATNELAGMWEEERRKADETALLAAEVKLAQWENKRLYDPDTGALAVKGKDAQALPEQVNDDYNTFASQVASELTTDRQREAFARSAKSRAINIDLTVRRHVFQEQQTYRQQELGALIENAHSTAVANAMDPRRVGEEMQRGVDAIQQNAPRLGLGPQEVQKQIEAFRSATHVGVIDRMLAANQTKAAQVYYDEAKAAGQIDGDAMARVEKALEVGNLRSQAQQRADAILREGGTLSEQREKARGIDDPQLRDEVTQRLEHEAAVREHAELEQERTTLTNAYNIVDAKHTVDAIPVNVWTQLRGEQRSALRSYADRLARGLPIETDLPTYYKLMMEARDDPEGFAHENLLGYKAKLDDGAFKSLTSLQLALGPNGDRNKAERELAGFRTKTELLDDTLVQFGIDPKAKPGTADGDAIAQLRRMLDRRIDAAQEGGKKISNTEIQQTIDDLLSTREGTPGSWWNIFKSWTPGHPIMGDDRRLIDLKIGDVPANDRTQIEDALRRAGRPVSDATVLDLYLEMRVRTRRNR